MASPDDKSELPDEEQPGNVPDYNRQPVPRLPRGKGTRFSTMSMFRIAMLGMLLVAVLVMRKPCADGVAKFIGGFEQKPDAGAEQAPPRTTLPPGEYIKLDGPLTEEKLKELRERAKKRQEAAKPDAGAADSKKPADSTKPAPGEPK